MAKAKRDKPTEETVDIRDYRYTEEKRKNIPPAGLAAQGVMESAPKQRFYYDPHLPPVLAFDKSGNLDKLPLLLEKAKSEPLSESEVRLLADALRKQEPWLEWTGKREKKWFEVDPVALNIHERVSTQAILKIAKRENVQRDLFADPELEYRDAVKFYKHNMDWTNRLILGDSLQVMASLAYRESLAGKVQMIYFDPPYGIKFGSNFQTEIRNRDVKDQDSDLTREAEMIKAYRDTWTLGIHSYLGYLRERLIIAKKLLTDSGSIFVQISDTNLHLIKNLLDEVFGIENFGSIITFSKAAGQATDYIPSICDYIVWYAKDKSQVKFNKLYQFKEVGGAGATGFTLFEKETGEVRPLTKGEINNPKLLNSEGNIFDAQPIVSQGWVDNLGYEISFEGSTYFPPANRHWTTTEQGMLRAMKAGRLIKTGNTLQVKKFLKDFPVTELSNFWIGLGERGFAGKKLYVVQTAAEAIKRCVLMTTSPGDLVLDPTCGSGTTAFVSEEWGRRWVTIDTSRVAIALARQRILTAKFQHFQQQDPTKSPSEENPFDYERVPYISLKSIAQNLTLDPIFEKYDSSLNEALVSINEELKKITKEERNDLLSKLIEKQKTSGKKSITEGDRRNQMYSFSSDAD